MIKFKKLIEIKHTNTHEKTIKVLHDPSAYVEDPTLGSKPILEEDKDPSFDNRLQQRFVTRGNWSFESVEDFKKHIPEKAEDVVPLKNEQPAIGLFDAKTLARVQKNFPYKSNRLKDDD
jgi:hypothetical protein